MARSISNPLGKYYIVDIGLRNYLPCYRSGGSFHILKNIIYFELLRRGYDVSIGKLDNKEVDFIVTKTDEKKYIQVTESMDVPETRDLSPPRKIPDNYEKPSSSRNATSPRIRTASKLSERCIFCSMNDNPITSRKADRPRTCQLFLFLRISRLFQFILHGRKISSTWDTKRPVS